MKIKNDESIFMDFIYQDGDIESGYKGTYKLGTLNGTLGINGDTLELRLHASDISSLSTQKKHTLLVAFENESIGYKEYIHEEIIEIEVIE